jgi:hypothetical protein
VTLRRALLPCVLVASGCQDDSQFVYVPASPPKVELLVSASATEVTVGAPVVLRAERRYEGEWQRVERASLRDGQCWIGRPPPEREREVADNLRWQASPDGSARFNVVYREDRTREVTFSQTGSFALRATSVVYCGDDVTARPITIKVVERAG